MAKDIDSTTFSAREIRYLQSLPAVERVSQGRIHYTEGFKRDCIRRYNAGESPAQIFRRAGLDSSLIGYKRIERCIARWKRVLGGSAVTGTSAGAGTAGGTADGDARDGESESFEIPESQRWTQPITLPVTMSGRAGRDVSNRPTASPRDFPPLLGDRNQTSPGGGYTSSSLFSRRARSKSSNSSWNSCATRCATLPRNVERQRIRTTGGLRKQIRRIPSVKILTSR